MTERYVARGRYEKFAGIGQGQSVFREKGRDAEERNVGTMTIIGVKN